MIFMFQKSPALTAFWTFIWTNPKVARKVAIGQCQNIMGLIYFITIYQANIFGQKPDFQTKYFRWNTDFSKVLFSAKHQVFKRNIFGGTPTFQTKYFRWNTDFSNEIFSATQGLFILSTLPFQ